MATEQTENPIHKITNGPNKFEFMLSLFDGVNGAVGKKISRREIEFTITVGRANRKGKNLAPIPCLVQSAEREDGSGESFNFTASCQLFGNSKATTYHGQYNTRSRVGWLQYINK